MSSPPSPNPAQDPSQRGPFDTGVRPEDLEPGRPVPLRTPWGEFALYPTDRGVLCAAMFCPHMEGPLWEGSMTGTEMVCPWHRWRYDLGTGRCVDVPGCEGDPEAAAGADAASIGRLRVTVSASGSFEVEGPAF